MNPRDQDTPSSMVTREVGKRLAAREADRRLALMDEASRPPVTWFTGGQLRQMQFSPLDVAIPMILPEGVAVMAGKPKIGKSWIVYGWALALAAGGTLLGCLNGQAPRPVLYFALEDAPKRLRERAEQLGYAYVPDRIDYVTTAAPDQVVSELNSWLAYHAGRHPVAIIDTWARVSGPARRGETTYDRDYRIGADLKQAAAAHPGSVVLAVHHNRKAGADDFLEAISGTFGIAGSADTLLVLDRKRHSTHAVLQVTGRDIEENRFALDQQPNWVLTGGSLEASMDAAAAQDEKPARRQLGERSQDLIDGIGAAGQLRTSEAARLIGVSVHQAGSYLKRLWESGYIGKAGTGIWVPAGSQAARQAESESERVPYVTLNTYIPTHPYTNSRIVREESDYVCRHTHIEGSRQAGRQAGRLPLDWAQEDRDSPGYDQ